MIRINDISLRNKLVMMQVFTSVLVLALFFAAFIYSDTRGYKQRKAETVTGLAEVIGLNSIPMFQFEDEDAAAELLSGLRTSAPDVIHAWLTDVNGNVFATYSRSGKKDTAMPPHLIRSGEHSFDKDRLYVRSDIREQNTTIGSVFLEIDLDELTLMKRNKTEIATILLLVALGFSVLVSIVVQRYFSRRLFHLLDTMKSVTRTGNYTQYIPDHGKDEIGQLINGYNDLMQKVNENQRRRDEFIGIASHELKTPLTTVKGYMELLNIMSEGNVNKRFVEKALENVNKLEKLIKDLLDVSKIQSGNLQLSGQQFSMSELLDETIANFQMITKSHEICREDQLKDEVVFADRQRIEQVLINLLSNAIKYSPNEKRVVVRSEKKDDKLIIKVVDSGIGIPPDEWENIFGRFYRTPQSSDLVSGFGLGLYISRDIVRRHGGDMWLEHANKGSVFCFSVPLNKTVLKNQPAGKILHQGSQPRKPR